MLSCFEFKEDVSCIIKYNNLNNSCLYNWALKFDVYGNIVFSSAKTSKDLMLAYFWNMIPWNPEFDLNKPQEKNVVREES